MKLTLAMLVLLAGCDAPAPGAGGDTSVPDTDLPDEAACATAPAYALLADDPSDGAGEIPFAGTFPLEFVSAPVSWFWGTGALPRERWSTTLSVEADGYRIPVFEPLAWGPGLNGTLGTGVVWPVDSGPMRSDVDLCSASFTLRITVTELDVDGAPKAGGACTTTTTTRFRLAPDPHAAGLCPLFLTNEDEVEAPRLRLERQLAKLADELGDVAAGPP